MRVQVPPSAPTFSRRLLRFLARKTLAVKSSAQISRLTLAELWLFFELRPPARAGFFASPGIATGSPANRNSGTVPLVLMHVIGLQ